MSRSVGHASKLRVIKEYYALPVLKRIIKLVAVNKEKRKNIFMLLRHLLRQENGVTKRRPVRDDVVQRAFPQRKQDGDDVRAGLCEVIFASQFLVWLHIVLSPYGFVLVSVTCKCITEIFSGIYLQRLPAVDNMRQSASHYNLRFSSLNLSFSY